MFVKEDAPSKTEKAEAKAARYAAEEARLQEALGALKAVVPALAQF